MILDLGGALNLMTCVLIRESKDRFETQRYKGGGYGKAGMHREEVHMKTETDIGVRQRQPRDAKGGRQPSETG